VVFLAALVRSRRAALLGAAGAPYRYARVTVDDGPDGIDVRGDRLDVRVAREGAARCDPTLTALVCAERQAWIAWGPVTLVVDVERAATAVIPGRVEARDLRALDRAGVALPGVPLCGHVVETGNWLLRLGRAR
jgi:hypothetical protein